MENWLAQWWVLVLAGAFASAIVGFFWEPNAHLVDLPLEYDVRLELLGESLRQVWHQLEADEETMAYVESCGPELLRDAVSRVLRQFMSKTDANGWAGRKGMFVLSEAQVASLCPHLVSVREEEEEFLGGTVGIKSLLDIGSGDGSVTERFAGWFDRVVATETSSIMVRTLRRKGWEVFQPPQEQLPAAEFDLITCFNVLDRADKPLSLLKDLRVRLKPETGRLILAVVLPWCPQVESGTKWIVPSEKLPMEGAHCRVKASFEESLEALVNRVITPAGFEV